jgi:hypothetical protein
MRDNRKQCYRQGGGKSTVNSIAFMMSRVLTAANMKMTAFWNIAPCSLVEVERRFSGIYCCFCSLTKKVSTVVCHRITFLPTQTS